MPFGNLSALVCYIVSRSSAASLDFQVLCLKAWTLKSGRSKPQVANWKDILVVDARPEATEFGLGLSGILNCLKQAFDYECNSTARQELPMLRTPPVSRGLRDELVDSPALPHVPPVPRFALPAPQLGKLASSQQKKEAGHPLSTFVPCTTPSVRSLSQSNAV